ncbi:hypothetical protein [Streptomyces sp. NBC_00057]|uniref:hypothetical protein n=1 Tax=Streptomyces sp. NBC_00057 TaxID=2975634 RepID=UPI0032433A04
MAPHTTRHTALTRPYPLTREAAARWWAFSSSSSPPRSGQQHGPGQYEQHTDREEHGQSRSHDVLL